MPAPTEKRGQTVLWLFLALLTGGIGFASGGFLVYHFYGPADATEGSSSQTRVDVRSGKVSGLGRIEPKHGVLSLGVPTPDRIAKIKVKEGQTVKRGEELIVLHSATIRDLQKQMAEIHRKQAVRRLKAIQARGEAQIRVEEIRRQQIHKLGPLALEAQESKIKLLKARKEFADKDLQRYNAVSDTISEQEREKARLQADQIQAELTAADHEYKKLLQSNEFDLSLADAQLKAARAELENARSTISQEELDTQVAEATQRVQEARINAPSDGKILRIMAHEGDLIGPQPILQMADTTNLVVIAEIEDRQIERIEIGKPAEIFSDIFPREHPLEGKVVSKGEMVGKPQVINLNPRAAVDNRVIEVKIELEPSNRPEALRRAANLIGHEVHVDITAP